MHLESTKLQGAYLVHPDRKNDSRGFFARTYCEREFAQAGLASRFVQCNISFNENEGTLRGLHFQVAPAEEPKLVRCTRGKIFDVIVDLRKGSPNFCSWIGVELSEDNRDALFIPPGFAHGFQTLEPRSEVFYQMGEFYHPELARGVRWNDPAFKIVWPKKEVVLSEKDAAYPDFVMEILR